jgi:Transcriptional regulator
MSSQKINSSNIFAKECVVSALLSLIYQKPLSSITISELCKKAGVSRMTFYRNYDSKEDIFKKHLAEIFEEYKKDSTSFTGNVIFYDIPHMVQYFNYLYKYKDFLAGLIHCGYGMYFFNTLAEYVNSVWIDKADIYVLTSFSGSLYSLFCLWAGNQYKEDVSVLANKLSSIYAGCTII